ncbi:MAG: hypothetical protein ABSA71_00045 [Desulfomonilia bacterium]
MGKMPQKLDKTRKGYYANASIAAFGARMPEFSGLGRVVKNKSRMGLSNALSAGLSLARSIRMKRKIISGSTKTWNQDPHPLPRH